MIVKELFTFENLIKKYSFQIPDYQRAYAWGKSQIEPFINDILEYSEHSIRNKNYYLGHFILENSSNGKRADIIDGQQRISTIYLFLLVCKTLSKNDEIPEIHFSPVSFDEDGLNWIKNILEQNDSIESKLLKLSGISTDHTKSLNRMIDAVKLFLESFLDHCVNKAKLKRDKIDEYIEVILKANCSSAIYNDKAVSSQIFELHNTRGIGLTETEKVKSLLMKNVYVNSDDPDDIKVIQEKFAEAFKMEEKASANWLRGEMPLDTILAFHFRAIDDGDKNEAFDHPSSVNGGDNGCFAYVKAKLNEKSKAEIVTYAKNVASEFAKTMEIITEVIPTEDKDNQLIGDILLLDRNRSIIFLLRAFRATNEIDVNILERWENFILSYEIISKGGYFYNHKSWRNNYESIFKSINREEKYLASCKKLLYKFYHEEESFANHWEHLGNNCVKYFDRINWSSGVYGWNGFIAYILYKYEIDKEKDSVYKTIREHIFKDDHVSIDHIVPKSLSWPDFGYPNYNELESRQEADEAWAKVVSVIHGIGNLALSTSNYNSSDSNSLPTLHVETYRKCGLVKTSEQVSKWDNPENFVDNIIERTKEIKQFISEYVLNKNDIWK